MKELQRKCTFSSHVSVSVTAVVKGIMFSGSLSVSFSWTWYLRSDLREFLVTFIHFDSMDRLKFSGWIAKVKVMVISQNRFLVITQEFIYYSWQISDRIKWLTSFYIQKVKGYLPRLCLKNSPFHFTLYTRHYGEQQVNIADKYSAKYSG